MDDKPDIIAITEVVPKSRTYDVVASDYHIEGYDASPAGINERGKRGILILTKSDLEATPINVETDFSEALWLKIRLNQRDNLALGCVYRSPNSSSDNTDIS